VDSHKETQCRDKKAGKPKVNLVTVDDEVNAHMLFVDENDENDAPAVPKSKKAKGDSFDEPIDVDEDEASVGEPGEYFSDDEPEGEWELCSSTQCKWNGCLPQGMSAYKPVSAPFTSYSPTTPEQFLSYSPTSPTYSPRTPTYSDTSPPTVGSFSSLTR
jgi:hypothetical protein